MRGGLTYIGYEQMVKGGGGQARPPLSLHHSVHPDWRLPISGLHPIMMEKSALAGEGGGCTPTPFRPITITYKVAVYAPAERADALPVFHLYPVCALCSSLCDVYTELLRLKGLSPEIYSIIYILGFNQDFLFVC